MKNFKSITITFAMGVVALLSGCASNPGYNGAHGAEKINIYNKVKADLGECPSSVTVTRTTGGVSGFQQRSNTIIIGEKISAKEYDATLAHETVHLCLSKMSNGQSANSDYRFLDEGFAKLYDRRLLMSDEAVKRITYNKIKKYPLSNINFKQARDWDTYFGNPDRLGTLGWDAYYVGVSFHLFVEDTYGKDRPLKLMRELGSSMSFGGAVKAALGEDLSTVEKKWQDYVASNVDAIK